MKSLPLTETGMLLPFVHFLDHHGGSPDRQLSHWKVSREMVERGLGKITKLQFYQVLNRSGKSAGLPDLGFRVGEHYGMKFIGPVGASVLRAATLKDAFTTFATHLERWLDDNHLWMEEDGDHVWICNEARDGLGDLQEVSNQCALMSMISLVREAAGKDWCPDQIRLPATMAHHFPDNPSLANASVVSVGSGVGVRVPREFLALPVQPDEVLQPEATLLPKGPQQFAVALERVMSEQLLFMGVPTVPEAAEISGTSVRSLQRQLAHDGLTYKRLIERIRFRMARARLEQSPDLQINELSAELHYSNPSSFVRAFRRTAGCTPEQYRRTSQEETLN